MITPNEYARTSHKVALALALAAALGLAACGQGDAENGKAGSGKAAAQGGEHGDEKAGGDKDERAGEKGGEHAEGEEALKLTNEEAQRAGVKVEAVKPQPLGETIEVTATIQPNQDRLARVSPRIEGRVTSAPAKLGDRVRDGQTLATLNSVEVGEVHAAWVLAQSDLRIAEADFQRAEEIGRAHV